MFPGAALPATAPCGPCCQYADGNVGEGKLLNTSVVSVPLEDGNYLDTLEGANKSLAPVPEPPITDGSTPCNLQARVVSRTQIDSNEVAITFGVSNAIGAVEYSLDRIVYQDSPTLNFLIQPRSETIFVREKEPRGTGRPLCETAVYFSLATSGSGSGSGGSGSGSGGSGSGSGSGSSSGSGSGSGSGCHLTGFSSAFLPPIDQGVGFTYQFVSSRIGIVQIEIYRTDTNVLVFSSPYEIITTGPQSGQSFWQAPIGSTIPLRVQVRSTLTSGCTLSNPYAGGWGSGAVLVAPALNCGFGNITIIGGPNTFRSFTIPGNTFSGPNLTYSLYNVDTGENLTGSFVLGKASLQSYYTNPSDLNSALYAVLYLNEIPVSTTLHLKLRATNSLGSADYLFSVTSQINNVLRQILMSTTAHGSGTTGFDLLLRGNDPITATLTPQGDCPGPAAVSGTSSLVSGQQALTFPSTLTRIYALNITTGGNTTTLSVSVPLYSGPETIIPGAPGSGSGSGSGTYYAIGPYVEIDSAYVPSGSGSGSGSGSPVIIELEMVEVADGSGLVSLIYYIKSGSRNVTDKLFLNGAQQWDLVLTPADPSEPAGFTRRGGVGRVSRGTVVRDEFRFTDTGTAIYTNEITLPATGTITRYRVYPGWENDGDDYLI